MGRKGHKYGKNKKKIHTGGKSILHIRTSGAGYTKTKEEDLVKIVFILILRKRRAN